eukprot:403335687
MMDNKTNKKTEDIEMQFSIPNYGDVSYDAFEQSRLNTTTGSNKSASEQQSTEQEYVQRQVIYDPISSNSGGSTPGFFTRVLQKLNIDSLSGLEDGPVSSRDSRTLMKQMNQMKSLTRCISISLLILSVVYLITRIQSYLELKDYREKNSKSMIGSNAFKYQNIEILHYFTMIHSLTCVIISTLVFMMLKKNMIIDRRQYYFILGITTFVTVLYFFAILYIVYRSTYLTSSSYNSIVVFESILELIGSVSSNPLAFLFALMMNFVLLFGIFLLNLCSIYLADLARALEQKRTGGRYQNELELNSFVRPQPQQQQTQQSAITNSDASF